MQFRSVFQNYKFNVLPEEITYDQLGRAIGRHKGISLFFGLNHMADTEKAQREQNWTDEQRLDVERKVMSHDQFKRPKVFDQGGDQGVQLGDATAYVIYFAPGQEIPPEHEEFVKTCRWWQIAQELERNAVHQKVPTERCQAVLESPDGPRPCTNWAEPDTEFCANHTPIGAEV
jgi:hypothetical protein